MTLDSGTMYRPLDWFDLHYIREREKSPYFQLFDNLVDNPDCTVSDAVVQFNLEIETRILTTDKKIPNCWSIFWELYEVAQRTPPEQQSRLVEFLDELQKVKLCDPETGDQLRQDDELCWTQLPYLGFTGGEGWRDYDVTKQHTKPSEVIRYERHIAFIAQLSNGPENNIPDYMHPQNDFSNLSPSNIEAAVGKLWVEPEKREAAIRIGCLWLIYAPDRLLYNIRTNRIPYLNEDDWKRWENGLHEARHLCKPETLELVEAALRNMQRAVEKYPYELVDDADEADEEEEVDEDDEDEEAGNDEEVEEVVEDNQVYGDHQVDGDDL